MGNLYPKNFNLLTGSQPQVLPPKQRRFDKPTSLHPFQTFSNLPPMYNKYLMRAAEDQNNTLTWLWVILTLILVLAGALFLGSIPQLALLPKMGELSQYDLTHLSPENTGLSELYLLFMQLFPFPMIIVALFIGVKFIHKRSFNSLLTGFKKVRWGRFMLAFGIWFGFTGLATLITYLIDPSNVTVQWEPERFIPFAIMMVFLVPIQSSAEELLFRGYLMQSISRVTRHKAIPLVVTSVLFGLVHSMNPEVGAYGFGVMMAQYIGMGLILGIIALADEGLEMAMGLHSANNLFAFLFLSYPDMALTTPSVLHLGKIDPMQDMVLVFAAGALFILITNAKRLRTLPQRVFLPEPAIYQVPTPDPETTPEELVS